MNHDIEVTLSQQNRVITAPEDNPLRDVAHDETVTWICQGTAAGRGLQVVFARGQSPFSSLINPAPDQIRGVVSQTVPGGAVFAYDIVDRNGRELDWENGSNTGVIVIRNPPN